LESCWWSVARSGAKRGDEGRSIATFDFEPRRRRKRRREISTPRYDEREREREEGKDGGAGSPDARACIDIKDYTFSYSSCPCIALGE
jgi:hypothetical protein